MTAPAQEGMSYTLTCDSKTIPYPLPVPYTCDPSYLETIVRVALLPRSLVASRGAYNAGRARKPDCLDAIVVPEAADLL